MKIRRYTINNERAFYKNIVTFTPVESNRYQLFKFIILWISFCLLFSIFYLFLLTRFLFFIIHIYFTFSFFFYSCHSHSRLFDIYILSFLGLQLDFCESSQTDMYVPHVSRTSVDTLINTRQGKIWYYTILYNNDWYNHVI